MALLKSKQKLDLQHAVNNLLVCLSGVTRYTALAAATLTDDGARAMALKIAWAYLGRPYRWGGDDPMAGFDCSGFIVEILQSVGLIERREDFTAQGLWELFTARGCGLEDPDHRTRGAWCFGQNARRRRQRMWRCAWTARWQSARPEAVPVPIPSRPPLTRTHISKFDHLVPERALRAFWIHLRPKKPKGGPYVWRR